VLPFFTTAFFTKTLFVISSWYFGKIKRMEAEKMLLQPNNDNGAFLIRDSESRRNDYSLSSAFDASFINLVLH
jgi:hypothetical protein